MIATQTHLTTKRVAPGAWRLRVAFLALCGGPALMAGAARAADRPDPRNPCVALYGPGFRPLAGSSTCVRVNGRVRVEAGIGGQTGGAWRVAPEVGPQPAPIFGEAGGGRGPGFGGGAFGAGPGGPSHLRMPRRF